MKNTILKTFGFIGVLAISTVFSNAKAQEANLLQEVNLTQKENFKQLRNLVSQNFDFTNPNFSEGNTESVVKFEVAENGKINNVEVSGDCKYINEELKNVMTQLSYKFHNPNQLSNVYVMPINILIASR